MRYVIIGQKDSEQLLVVDTQLMTVTPVDQAAVVPAEVRSALQSGDALVDEAGGVPIHGSEARLFQSALRTNPARAGGATTR